jgi:hypothetical protein
LHPPEQAQSFTWQKKVFLAVFACTGPQRRCDLGFGIHCHLSRLVEADAIDIELTDEQARQMLDFPTD